METLSRRDFARLERPYPRVSYIFKHSITQEVVYRTLLTSQQQELHGAIAQELERLQPEAVERLAFHYRHADLSAPLLREKALRYLVAAGEKARREYANETALAYFDRALALENHWPWLAAKVELLHILGRREEERAALEILSQEPDAPPFQVNFLWADYYEAVSDYPAAQAAAEQALAAAQAAGDRRAEARALLALAEIARRQGRFADEEARYRQTLALLGNETAYQAERAEVLYGLGILHRQQGQYADAESELEEALALHRALNDRQAEARTLTALASIALLHRRDYSAARHYNQQALELRRTIGDRAGEGASLLSLAQSARALGDYGEARRLLLDALTIQRATNNRWREAIVLNELGIVYLLVGRLSEAESHLREALALSEAIGAEAGRPYVLVNLGQVLREAGRIQEAQTVLEEGLAIAQRQGDRYLQAQYLSDLALTHLAAEDWSRAVERATDALTLLRDLDLVVSTTTELTTLALAYWALGEEQDALYCVDDALEILDACQGDGPDFPHRDYFICARVLAAAGQVERSQQALAAAHRLLQAQVARISDEAMRRSYLEDVRVNREIALGAREVG
ncbi:MAG: tetratricopeptide repeat protein [Caldilineae bacterium]|nr:MAG: tetratricopeptide repeat protein [Caldilineae bacterium]